MAKSTHSTREVQYPVEDEYGSISHPAFANVQANRVHGGVQMLYASDFAHHDHIRLRISRATYRRSLNQDWHHGSLVDYIEVAMSEAQWATFVSTLNSGSGTPCTLITKDGVRVPDLPPPTKVEDLFRAEMGSKLTETLQRLDAALAAIDAEKLTGAAKERLRTPLEGVRQELVANLPFVVQQFGEHMETRVETAKVEIEAHIEGAIRQRGLDALQTTLPISLPAPEEEPSR